MIKSQIFALSVILTFMPALPSVAKKSPTAPKPKAEKIVKVKKAKAPASFRGLSSAKLRKLHRASAKMSVKKMSKKGEVAKSDSTFTWEYVLIFLVIAGGAAITLLVI